MVDFMHLPWLLTCASLICSCCGQGGMVSVLNKLKQFEADLMDNKMNILRMEKKVLDTIDVTGTSLRAELKENIRDEVKEAMAEILQGESLQDMVKSQVVSELRHLKQGYHQMRRQFHQVSKSLRDFQGETAVFQESLLKTTYRENLHDICVRDNIRLEKELLTCAVNVADLKTRNEQLEDLNETCQIQLSRLNKTVVASTPRPEEEKRRILIAPGWSYTPHPFRQLNIHNNSLSIYQYHTMTHVTCIAYISKTRKLLIGSHSPYKIVSSTLDTRNVTVLREGVETYGMAVDEDRDIIFMSTTEPRFTISCMSTQGEDLASIIDLTRYASHPRQITLDTRRKRIYVSDVEKVFTVTYDGQGPITLDRGNRMYAITLDQTAGVLYYGKEEKLMKMTVSNSESTEVTTLNTIPMNVGLYRGTIYYSGFLTLIVGAVDVTNNTVPYTLQSVNMKKESALLMCLIP
ncbi:uncharacterized protein [Haliotis asinina]|uniref:uncharacterized protein n=1 Tax=Haliotis asinina TaxID=109174 RepID=UPI0035327EB6